MDTLCLIFKSYCKLCFLSRLVCAESDSPSQLSRVLVLGVGPSKVTKATWNQK